MHVFLICNKKKESLGLPSIVKEVRLAAVFEEQHERNSKYIGHTKEGIVIIREILTVDKQASGGTDKMKRNSRSS